MNEPAPHTHPGSIFMQPWWLDCVAKGNWEELSLKKNGELIARWPIVRRKVKGLTLIEMPKLTPHTGPWIRQTSEKVVTQHSELRRYLTELIAQIPPHDKLVLNLDPSIKNHLPFIWGGYEQSSQVTYEVSKELSTEQAWAGLKSSLRRTLKKAASSFTIHDEGTAPDLYRLIELTFMRKGKPVPYSKKILTNIVESCLERNRGKITTVRSPKGEIVVSGMIVYDDERHYYLCSGFDESLKHTGAAPLFLWHSLKEALSQGKTFDFEGSSIQGVERLFSSFGATQTPFHQIRHYSKRYLLIHQLKQWI